MIKMFRFSFFVVTGLQCLVDVANGDLFSNQRVFTMLESKVFKYNYLNFHTAKTVLYILRKVIQWMLNKQYFVCIKYCKSLLSQSYLYTL